MATVEHVVSHGRDHWQIRYYLNKSRKKLSIGKVTEDQAREALANFEHLWHCKENFRTPDKTAKRWLERIPQSLYEKLAMLGLCEPRSSSSLPATLIAFCRQYIETRSDWKKPANYKQAIDKLEKYLGSDIPISAFSKGEAERWHLWMKLTEGLSPNTAGQNVKRCRQIINAAIDDKLIDKNPLEGVKIDLKSDKTKNQFISQEMTQAILNACPDQEWRLIIALARYGGLRCPSEVFPLVWKDIDWDKKRIRVPSSKTARYGKSERIIPMFPEIEQELRLVYEVALPGELTSMDECLISRFTGSEKNLRTQFARIVKRAGLEEFPKPFMLLRSSRRTELENSKKHANHVLNHWFGHTAKIAEKHYLQVTEEDYELAVANPLDLQK